MSKPGPISAKPLSILLNDVFAEAYAKQGFAARELVTRWGEIAGSEIAAHSEPLKMQWPRPVEGQPQEPATLVLRVEGPMALEIQHSADVILERVNRFFGWNAVGKLAFRQAPYPAAAARRDPARPTPRRWQRWPRPSAISTMNNCGTRWPGWVPQSSEIEPHSAANLERILRPAIASIAVSS